MHLTDSVRNCTELSQFHLIISDIRTIISSTGPIYFKETEENSIRFSFILEKFNELIGKQCFAMADFTRGLQIFQNLKQRINEENKLIKYSRYSNSPELKQEFQNNIEYLTKTEENLTKFFILNSLNVLLSHSSNDLNEICDPISKLTFDKCHNPNIKGDCGGFYLTTNESNLEATRVYLKLNSAQEKSCHIGFSGWYNFDIMVFRRSARAIIVDFSQHNTQFMLWCLSAIKTSPQRAEFIEKTKKQIKIIEKYDFLFSSNVSDELEFKGYLGCSAPKEVKLEKKRENSWLYTEERYHYIRKLIVEGKIICIAEDIQHTSTFKKLRSILKKQKICVDSLYISNICKHMKEIENQENFKKTVQTLIQPETIVINCPKEKNAPDNSLSEQHIHLGEKYLTDDSAPFFELT